MTTALTKNDYLPFYDASVIEYNVLDFTGVWYPDSMKLDIWTRQNRPEHVRVTFGALTCKAFTGFAQYWHPLSYPDLPILPGMCLQNGLMASEDGKYYLGEAINEYGNYTQPYIALLTAFPVEGETIEGVSKTYASGRDNTLLRDNYRWTYRTIQHYDMWGPFADVWRTGLREYETNHVYNYAFAKGIGMVDIWNGFVDANNNVVGIEYWALL